MQSALLKLPRDGRLLTEILVADLFASRGGEGGAAKEYHIIVTVALTIGSCFSLGKGRYLIRSAILYSETGEWKESTLLPQLGQWDSVLAINVGSNLKGILAFDSFKVTEEEKERCRLIRLAEGYSPGIELECGNAYLGVVRGRLRLSQSFWHTNKPRNFLLDDDADHVAHDHNATWVLVHDVAAETKDVAARMYLIGLYPDDGDVFFFFRHMSVYCVEDDSYNKEENSMYKYQIGRDGFEKVGESLYGVPWHVNSIQLFTIVCIRGSLPKYLSFPLFGSNESSQLLVTNQSNLLGLILFSKTFGSVWFLCLNVCI
ncbi:LOW QUALITY PROTEIN: hypothetical protein TorRG33x02_024750 [Trema orientale]|uniref:Uncharacterized protein n=1 Tax=Trema orientale TaxID=63057 RepID=A0A2P5FV87_TREOI|nr:LOW QUALITY PROTEIN: hypothetical protein TorRG33x02_024750 [Trema orientale]